MHRTSRYSRQAQALPAEGPFLSSQWLFDSAPRRYELHIETMALLDWYGGAHIIDPRDYFDSWKGEKGAVPLAQS